MKGPSYLLVFYAEEPDAKFRVMMMVMRMMMFFPKQADRQALPYLPYCGTAVSEQPKAGGGKGRVGILGLGAHFSMSSSSISLTSFVQ